jgi:hypothetical protein
MTHNRTQKATAKSRKNYTYKQYGKNVWDPERQRSKPDVRAKLLEGQTLQELITEIEVNLSEIRLELGTHEKKCEHYEAKIRERFGEQLASYHGGEVPSFNELPVNLWHFAHMPEGEEKELLREYIRSFGELTEEIVENPFFRFPYPVARCEEYVEFMFLLRSHDAEKWVVDSLGPKVNNLNTRLKQMAEALEVEA